MLFLLIYEDTKGKRSWIKFPNKEYLNEFIELENLNKNAIEIYEIYVKGGKTCVVPVQEKI